MPLRDHFRSPVNDRHRWDEVHGGWPMAIVQQMFALLPSGYQASPRVHHGVPFEIDVSMTEDLDTPEWGIEDTGRDGDGIATAIQSAPTLTVESSLGDFDEYEVRIVDEQRSRRLVAAIEIVSPANKDREDARDAFLNKVAALLTNDVGVMIVDIVSARRSNLYADLLHAQGRSDPALGTVPPSMYAVSLRTRRRPRRRPLLDAWYRPLTIGQPLPTLPLWLAPDLAIDLPLEPAYEETCRVLRIA